jgi:hypothetical protein
MSTFFVSSTKRMRHRSAAGLYFSRSAFSEEEGELERLGEADELELRGGGERVRDVPAVEGSAETHVSRARSARPSYGSRFEGQASTGRAKLLRALVARLLGRKS